MPRRGGGQSGMKHLVVAGFVGAMSVGCGGGPGPVAEVPDKPLEAARKIEQGHLLLFPIGDAASLLGRPVKVTEDGAWTIADARAPGCEVRVTEDAAVYSVDRTVDASSLTTVSAGFAKIIGFEARYGAADKVEIHVSNAKILKADVRGDCGQAIVDTVFVGTGKRSLIRTRELGGAVTGTVGEVTPGASHESKGEVLDTLEWPTDQAYGFRFKQLSGEPPLTVKATVPSELTEGDPVELRFETSRPAWLVVYFLEQSGKGTLLWPSPEEPEPQAGPGGPAVLPSTAEQAAGITLQAQLAESGKPARETLVVYAFAEKGDFDRVKPPTGTASDDGASLAAALTAKLETIPLSRWSRAMAQYVITPR